VKKERQGGFELFIPQRGERRGYEDSSRDVPRQTNHHGVGKRRGKRGKRSGRRGPSVTVYEAALNPFPQRGRGKKGWRIRNFIRSAKMSNGACGRKRGQTQELLCILRKGRDGRIPPLVTDADVSRGEAQGGGSEEGKARETTLSLTRTEGRGQGRGWRVLSNRANKTAQKVRKDEAGKEKS